jgi:hypothetical protein
MRFYLENKNLKIKLLRISNHSALNPEHRALWKHTGHIESPDRNKNKNQIKNNNISGNNTSTM